MTPESPPARRPSAPRWLAPLTVLAAVALVTWRFAGPAPVPAEADPTVFSAARARERLAVILGDQRPHPVGSEANRALRDRLLEELRRLGYRPTVQDAVACAPPHRCQSVSNVVATFEGDDEAVLFAAHYDSVAAGPGAADDGAGVAALLETARALKHGPPPRHTVVFLFSDGEEAGLLGARAFMAEHPLARRVRAAINLEARGTGGPSLMFETSGPTAPLAAELHALDRPITSSLFAAVYARMPNDTDFSVFRAHGVVGYNFAFLGGVARYHTALDDLAHLDDRSLQHHGDNALALGRALAAMPLGALREGGDAIWFDLLGLGVVSWPLGASLPLALLALVALMALAALVRRRERRFGLELGLTLGATVLALLLAVGSGFAVMAFAGAEAQSLRSTAAPTLVRLLPLLAAVPSLLLGWQLARTSPCGAPPWARYLGVWIPWALGGVLVAWLFPEACYLLVFPALTAAVAGLLAASRPRGWLLFAAGAAACGVAAAPWGQLVLALGDAVGPLAHPILTAAAALWVGTAWPLMPASKTET